jgi:farnesyl-diphosphate farnesyltransferase
MFVLVTFAILLSSETVRDFLEGSFANLTVVCYEYLWTLLAATVVTAVMCHNLKRAFLRRKASATSKVFADADEDQIRMMAEECILVDFDDNVLGHLNKKDCHLNPKHDAKALPPCHRAFSVFLFNKAGELLLQKRSSDKITFPDYWANSCCSHPLYCESELRPGKEGVVNAARRKLQQELGIPPEQVPADCFTFVTKMHYGARMDETWGEHEVDYILIAQPKEDVTVKPNANEVGEYRYFSKESLKRFVRKAANGESADLISPWFGLIESHFLHKWWDALSTSAAALTSVLDVDTIHHVTPDCCPSTSQPRKAAIAHNTVTTGAMDKDKKQGAYGKIKIHTAPKWHALFNPAELWAVIRFKCFGGMGAGPMVPKGSDASDETFNKIGFRVHNMEDVKFCDDMLCKVSRSFAAVIKQLPYSLRLPICVFYLVLRALDTVEDDMDLERFRPYMDEKRRQKFTDDRSALLSTKVHMLQTFHERLTQKNNTTLHFGEADERKLALDFDRVANVFSWLPESQQVVIADITKRMAKGMSQYIARDLREGTTDCGDYNLYCHFVAGLVGEGLSRMFSSNGLEKASISSSSKLYLSNDMGLFLQKTNIIRDYLEDLVDKRAFWPKEIWSDYAPTLASLRDGDRAGVRSQECLNTMVQNALTHVPQCLEYLQQLHDPKVFRFCAIPQLMAIATLAELYDNPKVYTGVVKISKGSAVRLLLGSTCMDDVNAWFSHFLDVIEEKSVKAAQKYRNKEQDATLEKTVVAARKAVAEACVSQSKRDQRRLSMQRSCLKLTNVLAGTVFVATTIYTAFSGKNRSSGIFARGTHGHGFLPRLTDSKDVLVIFSMFLSLGYLVCFSGIPYFPTTAEAKSFQKIN